LFFPSFSFLTATKKSDFDDVCRFLSAVREGDKAKRHSEAEERNKKQETGKSAHISQLFPSVFLFHSSLRFAMSRPLFHFKHSFASLYFFIREAVFGSGNNNQPLRRFIVYLNFLSRRKG